MKNHWPPIAVVALVSVLHISLAPAGLLVATNWKEVTWAWNERSIS